MKIISASIVLICVTTAAAIGQTRLVDSCVSWLARNGKPPAEYVVSKFSAYDVVLLSEDHRIRENLLFVQSLIPALYHGGIFTIGMEFGASEDQARLDSLVTAPVYDEERAREIMFSYNTGWAFREYMDVYRKAWEFNRTLPAGARKFRILNLSYIYNWEGFSGQKNPENMKKVFYRGNTERYRFGIVEREILNRGGKILVLTGDIHAFTRYHYPWFDYLAPEFVRYDSTSFGNLLYAKYPGRVCSIILHQPFSNYINREPGMVSPGSGAVEAIMARLENAPVGFDLPGTPPGRLPDSSYFSMGYSAFTLAAMYDGYVFLSPIHRLHGCTIDSLFVTDRNFAAAVRNTPDPDWRPRPRDLAEYYRQVGEYADVRRWYGEVDKK